MATSPALAAALVIAGLIAIGIWRTGLPGGLAFAVCLVFLSGAASVYLGVGGEFRAVAGLAVIVLGAASLRFLPTLRGRPADLWFGLFACSAALWAVITYTSSEAQGLAGAKALLFLAPLYVVGRVLGARKHLVRRTVVLIMAAWVPVVLYGFKQFALGYSSAELAVVDNDAFATFVGGVPRLASTLPTNQDFAAANALIIPLLAALALVCKDKLIQWTSSVVFFASMTLAILGMVRSTAIGAACGTAFVAILAPGVGRKIRSSVLVILIVAVVMQVVFAGSSAEKEAVRDRLGTLRSLSHDPALNARLNTVWPAVIREIRAHPFGHGVATTGGPALAVLPRSQVVTPDNGYFTLMYEIGVIGALGYVGWLISVGQGGVARRRRGVDGSVGDAVVLGVAGSTVSIAVAMLAGSYVQLATTQMLLLPLAGIAVSQASRRFDET